MTTSTSIHKVASVELGERRYHGGSSAPFWSREIVITDDKGNTHTVELYASGQEDDDCLKVAL
jgi:hypothetical protein